MTTNAPRAEQPCEANAERQDDARQTLQSLIDAGRKLEAVLRQTVSGTNNRSAA